MLGDYHNKRNSSELTSIHDKGISNFQEDEIYGTLQHTEEEEEEERKRGRQDDEEEDNGEVQREEDDVQSRLANEFPLGFDDNLCNSSDDDAQGIASSSFEKSKCPL